MIPLTLLNNETVKGAVTNNIAEAEKGYLKFIVEQDEYEEEDDILSILIHNTLLIASINGVKPGLKMAGSENAKERSAMKNKELIQTVKSCIKYQVVLSHCKAHTFSMGQRIKEYKIWYGNKRADELAVLV